MQRIEAFLSETEVPDWASAFKMRAGASRGAARDEVGFDGASFEWDVAPKDTAARFTLGPLDLRFPQGKLTLVSGATGSGKSALLASLLGGTCKTGSSG